MNGVVERAPSATAVCADAHRPRMGRRVAALHGADFHQELVDLRAQVLGLFRQRGGGLEHLVRGLSGLARRRRHPGDVARHLLGGGGLFLHRRGDGGGDLALARIFHEGNGICGEQCSSTVACEAERHSRGYGLRLRAPIWADRAAAKPFSGDEDTLLLRGNRRNPLNGNPQRSVRERLHEISGINGEIATGHRSVESSNGVRTCRCRSV